MGHEAMWVHGSSRGEGIYRLTKSADTCETKPSSVIISKGVLLNSGFYSASFVWRYLNFNIAAFYIF
jgi:hypothetical protein